MKFLVANLKHGTSAIAEGAKCWCVPPEYGFHRLSMFDRFRVFVRSRSSRPIEHYFHWSRLTDWRVRVCYENWVLNGPHGRDRGDPWRDYNLDAIVERLKTREYRRFALGLETAELRRREGC